MKTLQDKANELVEKYYNAMNPDSPDCNISHKQCVQCAKIAVDEIIKTNPPELSYMEFGSMSWWQEVLNCLNNQ